MESTIHAEQLVKSRELKTSNLDTAKKMLHPNSIKSSPSLKHQLKPITTKYYTNKDDKDLCAIDSSTNSKYCQRHISVHNNEELLNVPSIKWNNRRQSLPTDTRSLLPVLSPTLSRDNFHVEFDYTSCPGSPRRGSMPLTPIVTPCASISSIVSSLDGSINNLNLHDERRDHKDIIYASIERYLKTLDDNDYIKDHLGVDCDAILEENDDRDFTTPVNEDSLIKSNIMGNSDCQKE